MNVLLAGASGMIGGLILELCLKSDKVNEVRSLVRKPSGIKHPKLKEIVMRDFEDYSWHQEYFKDIGTAFFCIGVYTGQVKDELFKKITVNYPVEFGKTLEKMSPGARLCLLSGAGADRTEKSRASFARYKGMAENSISKMNLKFFAFRPAYIYPVTSRKEPNVAYSMMRSLYPVVGLMGRKFSIKSTDLAKAMFHVGLSGAGQEVLENRDIIELTKHESKGSGK